MIKPLLISIAALLALPNFSAMEPASTPASYNGKERFSPNLSFINSADNLEKFVDAAAIAKKIPFNSLAYAELLDNTIAYRFYKGNACKTMKQDWLAVMSDKLFNSSLSLYSLPDDILLQPNAAPGQQNAVMAEILTRKNLAYRTVQLGEYTAMEIKAGNNWYFFDVANEPALKGNQRLITSDFFAANKMIPFYDVTLQENLKSSGGEVTLKRTEMNAAGFTGSGALQSATGILSKTLWIVALLMCWVFRKRSFKMYAIRSKGKYVQMFPMQPAFNA